MNTATAKPKPSWTSAYTVIAFAMVACLYLQLMPKLLDRPDLMFLKPTGQTLFMALLPLIMIMQRFDAGTLTRGLLLLFLALCTFVGAMMGIIIYEDWPQWVAAWNTLIGR